MFQKMEVYQNVNKIFLAKFPRVEPVVLDNTALALYKTCPRKYFFRMVLGLVESGNSASYFAFGGAYHKYRESFELTWKDNEPLPFQDRMDFSHFTAVDSAIKLWNKKTNNQEIAAPHTKWDWQTRSRLKLSLDETKIWLTNEKKFGNIIVVMTEQPFSVEVVPGVFYGGRADQVVKWNNRLWGRDFKTSSKRPEWFKRTLKPSNQFIGYTVSEEILHGQVLDGQLVEVLYNDAKTGPKIVSYPDSFNVWEKGIWRKELVEWTDRVTKSRELDLYPANESHCPFCPFHMICSASNENQMEAVIESRYKVEPWDCFNTEDLEAA